MNAPKPARVASVRRTDLAVRRTMVAAVLATVALASGLAACTGTKTERRSANEDLRDKRAVALRVLATGETQGYLEKASTKPSPLAPNQGTKPYSNSCMPWAFNSRCRLPTESRHNMFAPHALSSARSLKKHIAK